MTYEIWDYTKFIDIDQNKDYNYIITRKNFQTELSDGHLQLQNALYCTVIKLTPLTSVKEEGASNVIT